MVTDGHRPIYTTSVGDSVVSVAQDLRNALEPLLLKYQVDRPPQCNTVRESLLLPCT